MSALMIACLFLRISLNSGLAFKRLRAGLDTLDKPGRL
jgi:hypothetical protein